jgi:branched-subunit amino acid ABC-type transport system permease component
MLIRKCPVCKKTITPVNLLGPGFSAEAGPVICKHCNSTISGPMKKYQGLVGIGMLVGFLVERVIMKALYGNNFELSRLFVGWGIVIVIALMSFVLIYEFLPLREVGKDTQSDSAPTRS